MANLPALTPTNFAEAVQFAEALAKSTMVPREYQRMPANILVAIQWGAELGLGPLQALQNIAVINGKPSVYGDAMLALVRGSSHCDDIIERIEGEGDNRTAVCEARRKGAAPVIGRFSVADAKRAGLWDKAGPWKQYPLRMLQMRARGFALRDAFPDVLRGVISAEEAADYPRQMKDVTPAAATSAELDAFAEPADAEPAGVEADLLKLARSKALIGYTIFRRWYLEEIDDDEREALRPYIKELQIAARRSEDIANEPPPEPSAPEYPREEAAPRLNQPPEGTQPEPEPDLMRVIKPVRHRRGGGWDWARYADEMIAAARRLRPDQVQEFANKNQQMLGALRATDADEWSRVEEAFSEHEATARE